MSRTFIVGADVYIGRTFEKKTICIEDGRIKLMKAVGELPVEVTSDDIVVDALGMKAVPGFIDMHTHGAAGVDVNNASAEDLVKMAEFLAAHGTTSFIASVLTDTQEQTEKCIEQAKNAVAAGKTDVVPRAELLGIHLEGPFLAPEYKGAMPEELLKQPDAELLKHYFSKGATPECDLRDEAADSESLNNCCSVKNSNAIRYMTVSPELEGAAELVKEARKLGIAVGIGHSGATYKQARKAIEAGTAVGTHIGNAMRLFHQHEPAIFGALLESDCYCEVICDGIHLTPEALSVTTKLKTPEKLIAVTDSIMAAGLPDGNYKLGVNDVVVENGDAKLASDGTRAGSTLTQDKALKNILEFTGITLEEALPMLTVNPAWVLGVYDRKGSIDDGKDADIVLLDSDNNISAIFAHGVPVLI